MSSTAYLSAPQALASIFVSPGDVFRQLQQARNWGWAPLLALFATYMLSNVVFYGAIDPEWVVNEQMAVLVEMELSTTEREELRRIYRNFADYSGITGGILSILATLFASLLLAATYMLLANTSRRKVEFNDWFVFVLWTQLPVVCKYLGFLSLFLITPSSELQLGMMNYSSLNQLVFAFDSESPLYQWAEKIDIFYLGQIAFATIGLRVWCGFSYGKSLLIAALPYLVLFGGWLVLI